MAAYGYEIGAAIRTLGEISDHLEQTAKNGQALADIGNAVADVRTELADVAAAVRELADAVREQPRRRHPAFSRRTLGIIGVVLTVMYLVALWGVR